MHHLLEVGAEHAENEIIEQRLFKEVCDVLFSGQFDNFDFKQGILTDYKFTTVYSVMNKTKEEYISQGNCLRLLLHEAGYTVNEIQIVYILRDWSKMKAGFTKDYPPHQVVKVKIPMWSLEEAEKFLVDRVTILKSHEDTPDTDLPDCSLEDKWQDPSQWAVYKQDGKRAVKLHDNELDAKIHMSQIKGRIEFRPSVPTRCENYCKVKNYCNQYKREKDEPSNS
jgi:hypothetical protein